MPCTPANPCGGVLYECRDITADLEKIKINRKILSCINGHHHIVGELPPLEKDLTGTVKGPRCKTCGVSIPKRRLFCGVVCRNRQYAARASRAGVAARRKQRATKRRMAASR